MTNLIVEDVTTRRHRRDWLDVPARVFARDHAWIRPLDLVDARRIQPKGNPFFTFGEAAFFIAYRDGKPVGRLSSQINARHLDRYADQTGHFGFFDAIDDDDVAAALFARARAWLAARGMARMVGPFSLSVNEEAGLLVEGFDSPPAILMPHGAPWYERLLVGNGLSPVKDLLAYRFRPDRLPASFERAAERALASGRVVIEPFDLTQFAREADRLVAIFNDAWSGNWAFVPLSEAEIVALVAELKPILRPRWGHFVQVDGKDAGFIVALPDINRVIAPFAGRLLPLNWLRILAKLRRGDWETARIPLMGLRQEAQKSRLATGLFALLIGALVEEGRNYPIDWIELSWVLADNRGMTHIAGLLAGPPVKRYRLFEGLTT